jgi:hypothetical protein
MDKNILLGIIVIIFLLYLYNNIYDQFRSINENYENIVQSKYANNMREKTYYETILNTTVKTINLIPKINHGVKLSEYELYNNTNNLIVSMLSKNKEENKDKTKTEPSIFETFYERVMSLKPLTENSKSLIENESSDISGSTKKITQDTSTTSNVFGINILFWAFCFVVSVGVIYVIVQNGEKAFKSLGFNKINKVIELTPTETSLVDSLTSPRSSKGGNNIYYTGGYDINLYSE